MTRHLAVALALLASACSEGTAPTRPIPVVAEETLGESLRPVYERALAAVERAPDDADAWRHYGRVLHAHQLWEQAHAAYGCVLELDPTDVSTTHLDALVLEEVGEYQLALTAFARVHTLMGSVYAPAERGRIRIHQAESKLTEAAELAYALVEACPDDVRSRLAAAELALLADTPERAVEWLAPVARRHPDHRPTNSTLALAYGALGDESNAKLHSDRAAAKSEAIPISDHFQIELDLVSTEALVRIENARRLLRAGRADEALVLLAAVEREQPDALEVVLLLAEAEVAAKRYERALAHYERAFELEPNFTQALVDGAAAAIQARRADRALEWTNRALAIERKPTTERLRARSLSLAGRPQEAVDAFGALDRALRLEVDDWMMWGDSLSRLGRPADAAHRFEEALKLSPNFAPAHFNLGAMYALTGRLDDALGAFETAARLEPRLPTGERIRAIRAQLGR